MNVVTRRRKPSGRYLKRGFYDSLNSKGKKVIEMNCMNLYGRALFDYYNGDFTNKLYMCRDDGFKFELPIDIFFRDSIELGIDKKALDICFGKVIDIGAGTGLHSLNLQNLGFEVVALDISQEACEVMKNKGVQKTICADMLNYSEEQFDTILLIGRGIGAIGTIDNLPKYLKHFRKILKREKGQIIINSCDMRKSTSEKEIEYVLRNQELGRYFGEITYHFEYCGQIGESFKWTLIDKDTLSDYLKKAGFSYEVIHEEEDGNYLIRIF